VSPKSRPWWWKTNGWPRWPPASRANWIGSSQALTGRIRQLAERYATPLPKLAEEVELLAARVDEHLKKMGFAWK